jgi:hypothetical protein
MDQGTWNRLSGEQQQAVRALSKRFIKAVQSSSACDGWDFHKKYSVQQVGSEFVVSDGVSPLPGISHADRAVIEALMTDAIQNYGR